MKILPNNLIELNVKTLNLKPKTIIFHTNDLVLSMQQSVQLFRTYKINPGSIRVITIITDKDLQENPPHTQMYWLSTNDTLPLAKYLNQISLHIIDTNQYKRTTFAPAHYNPHPH